MKNHYQTFAPKLTLPVLNIVRNQAGNPGINIRHESHRGYRISAKSFLGSLSIALVYLLSAYTATAQLAQYQFNSSLGATCLTQNVSVSSQPANAVFSTYTNVGGTCNASTTSFVNSNLNTNQTLDLTEYNTFNIAPNAGYALTLTSVTLTQLTSKNGTSGGTGSTWVLRSSIDNYAANLGTGTATTVSQTTTVNLPAGSFTNIGAVTFRLYAYNIKDNGTTWTHDNVSVAGAVNPLPANPANPTSNSPQCNPPGVTLTRNGTPPGGITWYWQTSATGTSTTSSTATYNATTSGTYYIRAQNNTTLLWSAGAGSLAVTVTPNVGATTFSSGSSSTRCQAAGTVTYSASAPNATATTYTLDATSTAAGNTIVAATGVVTYTAGWSGSSVITATSTGCGTSTNATHTVTTTSLVTTPVFTAGPATTRCQGAATITYGATASNTTAITYTLDAASLAGGNTIVSTTGAVTYAASWVGTTTVSANAAGCSPKTATFSINVTPSVTTPVFTAGASTTRCQAGGTVTYTATASNTTGVTYSLDAVSISGGNSIDANTGVATYVAAWSGTSTITATAAGCNGPKTATHTVTTTPVVTTPVFTAGPLSLRCQGASTVTYGATASNTTGITYTLDAASTAGGNTIVSTTGAVAYAAAWVGTTTVTANAAGCSPKSATFTITVSPSVITPVFALGASSTRCQAAGTVSYTATATNANGITYTLDAASTTGGNSVDATTGTVTYAAGWSGTTTITATAAGCNGPKTATHIVTVTGTVATPTFNAGPSTSRCIGAGTISYTATAANASSITYTLDASSTAAGNTINSATGSVTYTATWTGTSTITVTAAGCSGPKTATFVVVTSGIVATPVFNAGPSITRCQGSAVINYGATATNTSGIAYSLNAASISGGNTINASTGDVTYAAGYSGTTIITASAAGCSGPKSATYTVTITPTVGTPVFTAGPATTRCQGTATITYTATATNNTGIVYSLDATSTTAGNSINTANGAVTYVSGWTGSSTITATATGCNGPVSSVFTVTTTPTVSVPVFSAALSATRCQGAGTVTYSATSANSTAITYSLDATSLAAGNSIVAGTGAVTYKATWSGVTVITSIAAGCNGPKTATYTVTVTPTVGTPVFAMGAASNRCFADETIRYSATATASTGLVYSLDAASIAAGNSLDPSTGDVHYLNTWIGTSVITVTASGCNGPVTATHTVTTNGSVTVPVFSTGLTPVRCQGTATVTYTAASSYASGIVYTLDATSSAAGNSINAATGSVTYTAAWTGTSVVTATASGCNGPQSETYTVTTTATVGTPVFSLGATSTRCQGAGAVVYDATATTTTGITYSLDAVSIGDGNSINAATGEVTYAAGWSGTTKITASAAGCSGPATAIHTVTVTPTVGVPVFVIGATSTRCQAAETVAYDATATNNTGISFELDAASLSGGNTINAATGDVTYVSGWTGTSTITATATGCNGPSLSTHTVIINPGVEVPVFSSGLPTVLCQASGAVVYSATATNTTGITYNLDAGSIAGGNTINSSTGEVTFASTWSGVTVITSIAAGCNGPKTATYTVTVTPTVGTPVFAMGAASNRCFADETIRYSATATASTGLVYSLDAASIAAGNSLDPSTGDVHYLNTWIGTSVITVTASGCNGPVTATHTVTTNGSVTVPVFSTGLTPVRCQGTATVTYTAASSYASGIVYTLDATSSAAGNSINAATGSVTYTAAWTGTSVVTATASGCNGPQSETYTVTTTATVGTPVFSLGATSTRCQGAGAVVYDATATTTTGITYSLDAVSIGDGNSINAATGEVTYAAGWSGTTKITASAAGCSGPATAIHTVTVTPTVGVPVFVIGATSTRCQAAETVAYDATATNNTGISFELDAASLSGGNTINAATGDVTYVSGWTGTSTITATATGCNGPSLSTHTVTTTPTIGVPVFADGTTSIRCQGAEIVPYSATSSNSSGITYSLDFSSRSGGNSINSFTGVVTYVAGWSGTSTITATAAGCNGPKATTHTVTITPTVGKPVFTMGNTSSRCFGTGVITYSANASSSTGMVYSLDASSLAAGNTINGGTGSVTYDATWIGTSFITATASGCGGPSSTTHTVTTNGAVTAPVFSGGASSTRCQGSGTITYNASASSSTGITYSLDLVSRTAGNTINAATGAVNYVAVWNSTSVITASAAGCYGPQTSTHTVTITPTVGTPVFNTGASSTRCQAAATVNYAAMATDAYGITYSLNAASRTAGNTINASTGDVTYVAGYTGTSIITATATGCNGPKTATHTVTVTSTVSTPAFTAGAASTRCQGASTVSYQATASNSTGITYSLDQASIDAGNSINAGTGAVTWDIDWSGTSFITASAQGCNGPKTATHTVTITPTVSAPVFSLGSTSTRCQGAAIVRYSATAANSTKITYRLDNTSYNFGANDYDPNTGDVYFDPAWSGTSVITATATGCNGPVTSTHTVTITPTVGTPVFNLGASSTRCQGAVTTSYAATASNSTGITYSLDAASVSAGNMINAATGNVTFVAGWLGNSTIKATAAGCNGPKSASHTVTSTSSVTTPVFTAGASSVRCQGAATLTYTASANNASGITYSLDAASTSAGNFIKANGQLTYVASWSGTTIITAAAAGCNGPTTATHTVTITPSVSVPVFSSGTSSTRCQGAATVNYSASASNTTGITYTLDATSKTAGNAINAATGDVTYVATWFGTSTITASAAGCNGPTTVNHTVTIMSSVGTPVFVPGSSSTRCQGAGSVSYTASASNSTGLTYSLDAASTAAGNSINNATGTVTYTAAWTGTSIITASASGCGGPKTSTHTVTITQTVGTPAFTSGATSTRCQSASMSTYTATATNSTGITYSLDATSLAAGNSIISTTGVVTYVAGWNGTSVITASAAGCNGPKTAQHTVTITPDGTPNFTLGSTSSRCQSPGNVTYTASNSNNSGVAYSIDAASLAGGNTINSATGVVTYSAAWTGTTQITSSATGCNGVKTAVHTVTITPNGTPVFAMGDVSSRLQSAGVVRYSATANNGATVTYSLDAASLAGGNTINASTGDVTYVASWNKTTTITAKASGCNGIISATHTVTLNSSIVNKQLYLSDPAQALDRVDPVSANDITTSNSATLGTSGTTGSIVVDNTQSNSVIGTSLTINNFVTGSGSNRMMLVGVALDATVTGVTYGGQNLTRVAFVGTSRPRVELWQLLNPASGTSNVVITTNASGSVKAGATTFTGVDQTSPLRLPASSNSGNSTPSETLTSAVNELVYDVVGIANDPAATASFGQSQLWNIRGSSNMTGGSSTRTGATSVTMSWATSSNPNPWSQIAVSIRPAPTAITTTTFTQSPALCLPLIIKASNNITVTNYISVSSGSMPASPNITATLRYGSTAIVTLKNPTYNSATGLLTWIGTLASDVTVPEGQAISMDITTAQSGVNFIINYDSKTNPSKIDLPVSTYIDITSLDVYTAAYPAGSVVISAIPGTSEYVRATVTDPFGFADINGVDINFLPSGGIKTATMVSSTSCSKTYETVWNTTGASGNYNIAATAKEGFENKVTSVKSTSFYFCTTCPPVAMPDSAVGAGGTPLLVDVLANDYDPNNNIKASSLAVTVQPQNGSALLSGGKIVYLPNGNFSGRDTLSYQICDLTAPASLCSTGQVFVDIDPTIVDPCSDAAKSHLYYIPYPEQDARTALLASQNTGLVINNIRSIISLKMPYPNMTVVWDHWEDGYETNILNAQQSTTKVWGDGNPYNGIAPGYPNDLIPAGGSIVLDNTMPANPRVAANVFYDGRDKVYASGQITMTQVSGEPATIGLQAMKTNISSTTDFGQSFTIPAGENFNSRDFKYTALFIRASTNNTVVNIDKDNNGTFETTTTLNEGESFLVNGGVLNGATITGSAPIGVDLHFGGVDNYSSREVPIFPATWYSNVYYTPVPTTKSPDSAVVMLYNSLSRPIKINWTSGAPASGVINLPAKTVVRYPLALSATSTYKFVNLTGEAFTAIEIVDSYTPGSTTTVNGPNYDWAFNLISEPRLTTYATIAWAPGSTDGTRNDNPIWVTPANNTTIYVKYDGDVLNGGSLSPSGLHYDISYSLNALNYKRILDAGDKDQSGIAIYTSDGTKIAAVYGEDPSSATAGNPSWDVGTTIQPFCALKLILANDDQAYTLTNRPVTINVLENDGRFQSQIDPSSIITDGYLQPKHGTVSVNSNGTLLYTPDPGYTGLDSLEYNVCSTPSPVVCDEAMVIINIAACPTPTGQNIISGQLFIDKNKDGVNNDGGNGFPNAKVYLYADGNCNGIATPNELVDSVTVDNSGSYQFLSYPEKTIADDFDGTGGTNTCASGSDGSVGWLNNWTDAGDPSVGFCVTPAQSNSNTDVEIVKDGAFGYALRMEDHDVSAIRRVNISGATQAYLSFSYRRAKNTLVAGENVLVQASTNGTTWGTIFTIAGDSTTDAAYVNVYNQDLSGYVSANTYIRFVTNANVEEGDDVFIDNVSITYLKYPQCYITKVDPAAIVPYYYFTTASQNAATANSGGTCTFPFDFGIVKSSITVSGNLYNDANGLSDALVNGIALGSPSGATIFAYLVDSSGHVAFKTTVNSSTGAYSFPLADIMVNYTLVLSTSDSALYDAAPAYANLPSGWVSTGETFGTNNGAGTGNKPGTATSSITIKTALTNITGVNFGIEQLPVAGSGINTAIDKGGTNAVIVPANTFTNTTTGSDFAPGAISAIRITIFPANVTTMTINGTAYTFANFPLAGVIIPANATGQPAQTITIDPVDGFVRVTIPFYAIDNAGKESKVTGTARMRFLLDTDKDGVADIYDIDDENDGITDFVELCGNGATTFSCLPNGSDPSEDDDLDGIVNYKDADFGTLNAAGCLASIDKDADGIPDYLDMDSDNDGIPDVVEAFGVDVNGDGIIDNFTDTDGDGLSQNVDANNTGATGSGQGLGFWDFDGDGISNSVDLDSDNDGIPDITEAGGVDPNNDGRVSSFTDANGNGLNDANETTGALLKTGADTNNDGRPDSYPNKNTDQLGYPNPYDLDSDGDGITDVVEAGFPNTIAYSNGVVTGVYTNGWANSVQAIATLNLANTDGRGPANYLDIDSDDDGISDNIEGQPTATYKVPADTDTDNDGLADAYDNVATFGGAGITLNDQDGDGIPDCLDTDTDNDGKTDLVEASKIANLTQAGINTADADGDGLLDEFDVLNVSSIAAGLKFQNVADNKMGANGSFTGPATTGSNVTLIRTYTSDPDRDWRNYNILTVGDLLWYDFNNNGLYDAGEAKLSGVTINLYADVNGDNIADGPAIAFTVTNATGNFTFTELSKAKYIVGAIFPTGYSTGATISTSANPGNLTDNDNNGIVQVGTTEVRTNYINLAASTSTLDIGLKGTGSIGDFVFNDANGNGIQDVGETGISGAKVTITYSNGYIASTTTSSSGAYSFAGLGDGTYILTFTTPAGYLVSAAAQGSDATKNSDPVNGTVSVTITAAQVRTDIDAGFYLPYTLGNAVWYDFNNNGLKDAGEAAIIGATVKLYKDVNADNVPDGAPITSVITDAAGAYSFTGLQSGNYIVAVTVPAGYTMGSTIASSADPNNATDNDNNGVNSASGEVRTNTIILSATNNNVDIGLKGTGSIGDFVFNDANGNGIQDATETGLAGVVVTLKTQNGATYTVISNASGSYSFKGLIAGTYIISFATPSGYIASVPQAGFDRTLDSDPVNGVASVTLATGEFVSDIDAGFYLPYSVGDLVWLDVNNNGLKDAGETGISGVTVRLYQDNNSDDTPDGAAIATTTTNTSGNYSFANLAAGSYIVGADIPSVYQPGTTAATSDLPGNNIDNDNNGIKLSGTEIRTNGFAVSANNNTIDFGLKGSASIGDFVWLDANGNGVQEAGEAGIPGVTVTLTSSGGVTSTTTTDASGKYSFTSLIPGTYTVHFSTPKVPNAPVQIPYIARKAHQGGNTATDSDPDPVTGNVTVTIATGEVNMEIDAAYSEDQDDDNDGIANSVENLGYEPFKDCDGDGIPNYLDASPGCALTPGTDQFGNAYKPLVWKDFNNDGINDFFDFDLDGVLNELDLDSDNDGIPDLRESQDKRVVDANNDGMADGVDNDGDGIYSSADQNDADYGDEALVVTDLDRDGKPGYIDLDSDGDGLSDAVEAGYPGSVTVANGIVTGASANGWANTAKALGNFAYRNSDARGLPNYSDIDSDDDGISDNIEGQSTGSYIVAADADTDGDGLADVYDVSVNIFGGNGITPYDHDADGTPDYYDLDTDNDGAPDINEASRDYTLKSTNINIGDADGDGLVDQFDMLNITTLSIDLYKNVTNSQMGAQGSYNGPLPSGSNVKVVGTPTGTNRDWRASYILPLSITSFTGKLQNGQAQLNWKVSNEQDIDHYVVERSSDAVSFAPVASVRAYNQAEQVYHYTDDLSAYTGDMVYYRISQVDRSGVVFNTKIIAFTTNVNGAVTIKVFPNPMSSVVTIQIPSLVKQTAALVLYDASGKELMQKSLLLNKGYNEYKLTGVSRLLQGVYTLRIITFDKTYVEKLIKE